MRLPCQGRVALFRSAAFADRENQAPWLVTRKREQKGLNTPNSHAVPVPLSTQSARTMGILRPGVTGLSSGTADTRSPCVVRPMGQGRWNRKHRSQETPSRGLRRRG